MSALRCKSALATRFVAIAAVTVAIVGWPLQAIADNPVTYVASEALLVVNRHIGQKIFVTGRTYGARQERPKSVKSYSRM